MSQPSAFKAISVCVLSAGLSMFSALSAAQTASPFSISPGNWVVTSELNGEPGRGMGLEVRDGVMVMTVYNYTASGDATFHLSAGPVNNNRFSGPLLAYKGGRSLGGVPRNAVQDGSPGNVEVNFTSATTGTIQFPGEAAVRISHFDFKPLAAGQFMPQGGESWLATELDDADKPLSSSLLGFANKDGVVTPTLIGNASPCTVGAASGIASCNLKWNSEPATLELTRFGRQLEGSIRRTTYFSAPRNRLVATRMSSLSVGDGSSYGVTTAPEPGMWVIQSENTGQPGRGFSVELQQGVLVAQLYGYEADGRSTFHIGSGTYANNEASIQLMKVRGGRYYGSAARTGVNAGSDGQAIFRFTSPSKGMVQLPGEQWAAIEKFHYTAAAPDPAALLGHWVFVRMNNPLPTTQMHLTRIKDGAAVSDNGNLECHFEATKQGSVRCTDSTPVIAGSATRRFKADYRFTPGYGVAAGVTMQITSAGAVVEEGAQETVNVLRVIDSKGVVAGVLP